MAISKNCPLDLHIEGISLFTRTFFHPLYCNFVEFLDINYLIERSNPDYSTETDTGIWHTPVTLSFEELYQDMLSNGMRAALLLGVDLQHKKVRLETGNQLVRLFKSKGFTHIPVIVYVREDSCITNIGNGLHEGLATKLKIPALDGILGPYPCSTYMRPSDVIMDLDIL